MNKEKILKLYKDLIDIFNNYETTKDELYDFYHLKVLEDIYIKLTDLLISDNIIEKYGIKKYKIVESGEII